MIRRLAVAVLALAALGATAVTGPTSGVSTGTRTSVEFEVPGPVLGGGTTVLRGFRMDPPCEASTVVFLQHGLSYTAEAWDFPGYSYARILADAGYAVVAIDRAGYGRSPVDDRYTITTLDYGRMAHEVVRQLRGGFDTVVLGGHSAGAEASELAAGLFGGVDGLVAMGYHQFPSAQIVADFFTGDYPRALTAEAEYFLGTPEHRAEMFYTDHADPAVVERDTEMAEHTPSGEVFTIGPQPSRVAAAQVSVPVLLQLADSDRLFPVTYEDLAAGMFLSAPSVTTDVVHDAGHTYMLHPTGPAAAQRIADWIEAEVGAPGCKDPDLTFTAPAPDPAPHRPIPDLLGRPNG